MRIWTLLVAVLAISSWGFFVSGTTLAHPGTDVVEFDCEDEDSEDDSARVLDCEDEENEDTSRAVLDCEDHEEDEEG